MADALTPVDFHGTPLYVTQVEGRPYVAIKPICDALTVNWPAQFKRIQRHPVLSTCIVITTTQLPGDQQERAIAFLPLDMLNGWLFGINAARVRDPECRTRLVQYQAECFAVLAAHFGAAGQQPALSGPAHGFSFEEAMCLDFIPKYPLGPDQQRLLNGKAYELAAEAHRIILDHVERRLGDRVPGNCRGDLDPAFIHRVLDSITLDDAMVYRHLRMLKGVESLAGAFLAIAQDAANDVKRELAKFESWRATC